MIILKNEADLDGMRVSGAIAAFVRDEVSGRVGPGVTTAELAEYAKELIEKQGGRCAFLGYRGFPGAICVSVNETVVHGIPGARRIQWGDIVSLDIGVEYDGYLGDTATTVMVGVSDPGIRKLVEVTEQALQDGIRQACAGGRVSNIGHAIETRVRQAGFSVVREFVGHGIGRSLHEDPQVPNFGKANRGAKLRKGMTLAIEPMVNVKAAGVRVDAEDGWTVLTEDGGWSAHFEHTVAVTEGAAEILTASREKK